MDALLPLLSKGGPTAIIAAALFALKWGFEAAKERRSGRSTEATASTNDLATANASLLDTLRIEKEGNAYLRRENESLRQERDDLADELFEVKRDYEAQLETLRRKLADISRQVEDLTARLQAPPPPV